MTEKRGQYACFFCEKNIAENEGINPCGLMLYASIDRNMKGRPSQKFYCHIECFKEAGSFKGNGIFSAAFNEESNG